MAANRTALISLVGIVCVLAISIVVYAINSARLLKNTTEKLFAEMFGTGYLIHQQVVESMTIDTSGDWWIVINDDKSFELQDSRFGLSYDDDLEYYKKEISGKFSDVPDLTGYELYQADIPLGEHTICEKIACNIYVLRKNGNANVFVGIYKN